RGQSAIGKMTSVIEALEKGFRSDLMEKAQVLEDATYTPGFAIGAIEAGWPYKPFTSPAICCAYIDFRIPLHYSELQAERELRGFLNHLKGQDPDLEVDMKVFLSKPSHITPKESLVYQSCLKNYATVMGKPYVRSDSLVASYSDDACLLGEQGVDVIVFGPTGQRFRGPSDTQGMGTWGERVLISSLANVTQIHAAAGVVV